MSNSNGNLHKLHYEKTVGNALAERFSTVVEWRQRSRGIVALVVSVAEFFPSCHEKSDMMVGMNGCAKGQLECLEGV
jgi:hypothetical protein